MSAFLKIMLFSMTTFPHIGLQARS